MKWKLVDPDSGMVVDEANERTVLLDRMPLNRKLLINHGGQAEQSEWYYDAHTIIVRMRPT